jgi:hypothetical protein
VSEAICGVWYLDVLVDRRRMPGLSGLDMLLDRFGSCCTGTQILRLLGGVMLNTWCWGSASFFPE